VVIALKIAVKDNSPYVRKAAAAAIPKIYNIAPEQKDTMMVERKKEEEGRLRREGREEEREKESNSQELIGELLSNSEPEV